MNNSYIDGVECNVSLGDWTLLTSGVLFVTDQSPIVKIEDLIFKFNFIKHDDSSGKMKTNEVNGTLEIDIYYNKNGGFADMKEMAVINDRVLGMSWDFKPFATTNKKGIRFTYSFFLKDDKNV